MWGLTWICAQTRERKNDLNLHCASRVTRTNVPQRCVMMYLLPLISVPGTRRESRWIWAVLRGSTGLPRISTHALENDIAGARSGGWCLSTFFCRTKKYLRNGQVLISSKGKAWTVPRRKSPFRHLSFSGKGCLLVQTSQAVGVEAHSQRVLPVGL